MRSRRFAQARAAHYRPDENSPHVGRGGLPAAWVFDTMVAGGAGPGNYRHKSDCPPRSAVTRPRHALAPGPACVYLLRRASWGKTDIGFGISVAENPQSQVPGLGGNPQRVNWPKSGNQGGTPCIFDLRWKLPAEWLGGNGTCGFAPRRAFDWLLSRQKPFGFEVVTAIFNWRPLFLPVNVSRWHRTLHQPLLITSK